MTNAIVKSEGIMQMTSYQIAQQVKDIQHLMKDVMKEDSHFGKIPGCGDKPTLLQPGAQKLCLMFMLADDYQIEQTDLPQGHREYRVKCTLTHKGNGIVQGNGYGICSTMESKYRYRTGPVEFTGDPVPREYWDTRDQKLIGGKGHSTKKNPDTGKWEIVKQGEKVDNPDIADTYNTVLKMACKRALVHATINATAASDIFTQDLEDLPQADQPHGDSPSQPDPPKATTHSPAPQSEFDKYRAALTRAKDERGVSIKDSMGEVERLIAKPREEYTVEDLARAVEIVDSMEAAPLEPNDIEF